MPKYIFKQKKIILLLTVAQTFEEVSKACFNFLNSAEIPLTVRYNEDSSQIKTDLFHHFFPNLDKMKILVGANFS